METFQLESMFSSIEPDSHKQYREPRKINLTEEEYKAIRSLKCNNRIVIKPADKVSTKAIMDKASYINEGQKQLINTQFYDLTDSDLTGEVEHKVNLHAYDMLQ